MIEYDEVLKKPFAFEHWHKGFVAAAAIWLPAFFAAISLDASIPIAVGIASTSSLLFAMAVFTHHERLSLDVSTQRYRTVLWVLGFRFGKWKKLPAITGIKVRPYQQKHWFSLSDTTSPASSGFAVTERNWQVLLILSDTPIGIIVAYTNYTKALDTAAALSKALGKPILTPAAAPLSHLQ